MFWDHKIDALPEFTEEDKAVLKKLSAEAFTRNLESKANAYTKETTYTLFITMYCLDSGVTEIDETYGSLLFCLSKLAESLQQATKEIIIGCYIYETNSDNCILEHIPGIS